MFHIELNGKGKAVGQFIVSGENQTLLVHCDISHHTEKGMKAQLVVGNGSGDLSNVMSLASQSGTSTLLVEFKGPE
jgi:hypothetical protein